MGNMNISGKMTLKGKKKKRHWLLRPFFFTSFFWQRSKLQIYLTATLQPAWSQVETSLLGFLPIWIWLGPSLLPFLAQFLAPMVLYNHVPWWLCWVHQCRFSASFLNFSNWPIDVAHIMLFASGTHPSQSLITIAAWKCLSDIAASLLTLKEPREALVSELSTYHS